MSYEGNTPTKAASSLYTRGLLLLDILAIVVLSVAVVILLL